MLSVDPRVPILGQHLASATIAGSTAATCVSCVASTGAGQCPHLLVFWGVVLVHVARPERLGRSQVTRVERKGIQGNEEVPVADTASVDERHERVAR